MFAFRNFIGQRVSQPLNEMRFQRGERNPAISRSGQLIQRIRSRKWSVGCGRAVAQWRSESLQRTIQRTLGEQIRHAACAIKQQQRSRTHRALST